MNSSLQFQYHTFGCKVNSYDTGLLQQRVAQHGFENVSALTVHVLNTCAVTAEATKEAVKLSRRLKSKDPFCQVVVTGCAAQVDTEQFADMPAVDLVVANSHKDQIATLIDRKLKGLLTDKVFKSNIFRVEDLGAGGGVQNSTRSFLKIQDGCNSFCSFCIIPFARGKSRSLPVSGLVRRVNELQNQGYQEVVLTGVHIGDYEDDKGNKLDQLVEAVLTQTQILRVRLSSLEPIEISEKLFELFQDPRLCPHFHMSIQSAQTDVLARMKRKYTSAQVEKSLRDIAVKVPGAYVGMDVIAGFTGETEEEFMETYNRLADLPWTRLHVFPYSERTGTKAAREEIQVPREVRMERSRRLRNLSESRFSLQANQQIGTVKKVLKLGHQKMVVGLSRDYWHVQLPDDTIQGSNHEMNIEITAINRELRPGQDGVLVGRAAWI